MYWEAWVAFSLACLVVLTIPGPTVLMVVSYGLSQGRVASFSAVAGVMLGDFVAITASLLGVGAILAASATVFALMKYAGAAYLIWLGLQMWRSAGRLSDLQSSRPAMGRKIFRDTFLVTVLNPKGMLFFVAFLPQFINPSLPLLPQFVIMDLTFVLLGGANALAWILAAGSMRRFFDSSGMLRRFKRVGGTGLIGAGLFTALSGRSG